MSIVSYRDCLLSAHDNALTPALFVLQPSEWEPFRALCASQFISIQDPIEGQIRELVRTAYPTEQVGSPRFRELMEQEVAAAGGYLPSYGVWVYYPWRRIVTHLLPPDRFYTVRTNRNRNKITPEEQWFLRNKRIGVVGLSVGHVSALVLAQESVCGELRIADFDTLELSNLNRLRTSVLNLGQSKAVITAREVSEIDPYLRLKVYGEGVTDENVERFLFEDGPLDLLVEECDNLPMKLRLRELARQHGIPVIMDTNDRGLLDVERFDREPARALLHGLMGDTSAEKAKNLSPAERLNLFYNFFGGEENVSEAFRSSMKKIGTELVGVPQLSSDVHLGGALVANAARRVLLGKLQKSGRYYVDLDKLIDDEGIGYVYWNF